MIKLSGKAKYIVPIMLVGAALVVGFVLDRVHETRFTVEKIKPGETNGYEAVATAEEPADTEGLININTADVKELTRLDGIGESIAGDIVSYRDKTGDFESVDELLNVKGIGESKLNAIRDKVCVR